MEGLSWYPVRGSRCHELLLEEVLFRQWRGRIRSLSYASLRMAVARTLQPGQYLPTCAQIEAYIKKRDKYALPLWFDADGVYARYPGHPRPTRQYPPLPDYAPMDHHAVPSAPVAP